MHRQVYIPGNPASIQESNHPVTQAKGIRFLKLEEGIPVYNVESGAYHFTAAFPA
jgi:hypothetical protein